MQLIRDSAKRIINVKSDIQPVLDISNMFLDSIRYPVHYLRIQARCRKASAYKVTVRLHTISETNSGFHFFKGNSEYLFKNIDFAVDMTITTPPIEFNEPDRTVKRFHFMFIGTYENLNGKKIPFRQLLNYDMIDKRMGYLVEPYNSQVIEAFVRNGIR